MENSTSKQSVRTESDLLGRREIPSEALYGVQTLRGLENFRISPYHMSDYPLFIVGMAMTKKAAALANLSLGLLSDEMAAAIVKACDEIIGGQHHDQFPVDMVQGGAGTSVNMNANEVIANRALEILGHSRGDYKHCSPNDHVNCSQSTNDAYPTAIRLGLYATNLRLKAVLQRLVDSLRTSFLIVVSNFLQFSFTLSKY